MCSSDLFQIVYGYIPRAPIDLISLNAANAPHVDASAHVEQMITIHEQIKQNIAATNAKNQVASSKGRKHVTFELGDMVWLHLRKDRFPTLRRSKLMPRAAGPFKVLTAIPIITGKHVSRPKEEILQEVRELVAEGVKEFQIIPKQLSVTER